MPVKGTSVTKKKLSFSAQFKEFKTILLDPGFNPDELCSFGFDLMMKKKASELTPTEKVYVQKVKKLRRFMKEFASYIPAKVKSPLLKRKSHVFDMSTSGIYTICIIWFADKNLAFQVMYSKQRSFPQLELEVTRNDKKLSPAYEPLLLTKSTMPKTAIIQIQNYLKQLGDLQ